MGGIGSGRIAGYGGPTCEAFPNIDILLYAREGVLTPGRRTNVNWTYHGEEIGTGTLDADHDAITLAYRFDDGDGHKRETIALSHTQPPLGGQRPWFVCPACGVRRLKLYYGGRFLCRACLGLQYQSTREGPLHRLLRRHNKACECLDGVMVAGQFLARRPKGMHHRTFRRLVEREATVGKQIREADTILLNTIGCAMRACPRR